MRSLDLDGYPAVEFRLTGIQPLYRASNIILQKDTDHVQFVNLAYVSIKNGRIWRIKY